MLRAKEKGIELRYGIKQGSITGLIGDTLRIKQIITNLLSNAVKFTESGKVEFEVLVKGTNNNTAAMEIMVTDTGIGVAEDKLDYIFQDFTQADGSTARKYGGTGLGLSIVKRLALLMKGTVEVESTPGKGSTFKCSLCVGVNSDPAVNNDRQNLKIMHLQKDNPDSLRNELASMRVLAAEDDPIGRKYIKSLLEYLGCNVTIVPGGDEVLEKLKIGEYDCILMDKNMPGLDGIETVNIIRRNEEADGRHIPIIALTASAISGDREKLLKEGMDYYISKPVDETELTGILKMIRKDSKFRVQSAGDYEPQDSGMIDKNTFFEEAGLYGEEVFMEIIFDFLKDYEGVLGEIESLIRKCDFKNIEKKVHRFAGTLSIFYCSSPVNLLKIMEQAAANEDICSLRNDYPVLKIESSKVVDELKVAVKSLESKLSRSLNDTPHS